MLLPVLLLLPTIVINRYSNFYYRELRRSKITLDGPMDTTSFRVAQSHLTKRFLVDAYVWS